MKSSRWMWWAAVAITVFMFLGHMPLYAAGARSCQEQYRKKIILFNEEADWADVRAFAFKWKQHGIVISMELPIINGLVVGLPQHVTDAEIAADRRVASIETNLELAGNNPMASQGASFIKPLTRLPKVNKAANQYEVPWSVLKLFDQPYDNRYFSGWLNEDDVPDIVTFSLKRLKRAKTPVAFFDTGIDARNKYTKKIVETGLNVVEFSENDGMIRLEESKPFDDNGHGSHVAGILGEITDRQHQWGRKSDVELSSVKVLDHDGMGYLSNIVYGLQWAIDHDIKVVNMSIGYRHDSPAVRRAVKEAAKAGVIMLASVGNKSNYDPNVTLKITADGGSADGGSADGGSADGGSADGGSADGGSADGGSADGGSADGGSADGGSADGGSADGGSADGGSADGGSADSGVVDGLPEFSVMYPARYPEVIAVGASNAYGKLATFSNAGPEMDILAPGASILSVDITNGDVRKGLGITSGTSMSVSYVTAATVMMLALDPTLGADEIREILAETAHRLDYNYTAGDLNLVAALDEVIFRITEDNSYDYDHRGKEMKYRKKLKAKIRAARQAAN